jgi:hypothetical protein
MSIRPRYFRLAVTAEAAEAEPAPPAARTRWLPAGVARRLAALDLDSLPWFREGVGLAPSDGGPEVSGAPAYAPRRRSRQKASATTEAPAAAE